jgi:hypothetical protein
MRPLLLAIALLAGCAAVRPLPSPVRQRPALTLAIDPEMGPWAWMIRDGVAIVARAGVRVALVPHGTAGAVRIVHGADGKGDCRYAGWWEPASRTIALWPACANGLTFVVLVAHEVSHAAGAHHVPAERGVAIMNPVLPTVDDALDCEPTVHVCVGAVPPLQMTELDLDALRAAGALPAR